MSHQAWIQSEWNALRRLHSSGADVPKPLALSKDAILMEYFGDEHQAAPMLTQVRLDPSEAESLFESVLWNLETMMSLNFVHGDLAAYNILYWDHRAVIIDLPQAVDLRGAEDPWPLLERDVQNLCAYFSKQGVICDPDEIALDLWERFLHGRL